MRQLARRLVLAGVLVAIAGALVWNNLKPRRTRRATVQDRINQFGARVDVRLQPVFERYGVIYPPAEIAFIAFKDARVLELYARGALEDSWTQVKTYAVHGASGALGPKLREGDRQVPEGIYAVEFLHPNSRFHLSLKLDYPNAFDRRMGAADGRTDLGSDIMIHGGSSSIGCLAMGDAAAEELFILAAHVGVARVSVLICPTDFRQARIASTPARTAWTPQLYALLSEALAQFPRAA